MMGGRLSPANLGTQPHLDLAAWIPVQPMFDDVPIECLRITGVTPDVLDRFIPDVQITFRYGLHVVGGNSGG